MDKELEKIRHSAAHILAQAVKELYPKAKLGIGPAIEEGFYYDFDNLDIKEKDLEKIEAKMREIVKKNLPIEQVFYSREEAKKLLKNEPYKLELLEEIPDEKISFFKQGNFVDLCKGPHVKSTSEVKAFKLTKIAGAYWKGDAKNKMLTRIYGVAFKTQKDLDEYLKLKEEAERRDHRKLGKELDLFSFHEESPGFVFWHPKGLVIFEELTKFIEDICKKHGYVFVKTPFLMNNSLWKQSGHWEHYKENMYFTKIDKTDYALKPMNCPGHILIYKTKVHSYKEFPLKIAEFGFVHRHELSGVLGGLLRLRGFTQDDAHIFCTQDQLEQELMALIKLVEEVYATFNLPYEVELSTRPEKYIGSLEIWNKAESALKNALEKLSIPYKINPGEGAFYGPKIDFHIKDSLQRKWQCGTIQVDFSMPQRFEINYEGKDGKKHTPIMIHRAILGSFERFIAILIEHYAGKFPLWLAPVQVRLLTVNDSCIEFAQQVLEKLKASGIRVELDARQETLPKKVREAQLQRINYIVTIGQKEVANKTLAIRTLDGKVEYGIKVENFIKELLKEIKGKK